MRIKHNDDTIINALLYADGQVLIRDSEDDLQRALAYILYTTPQNSLELKYIH
jgi:hypothetical protein